MKRSEEMEAIEKRYSLVLFPYHLGKSEEDCGTYQAYKKFRRVFP